MLCNLAKALRWLIGANRNEGRHWSLCPRSAMTFHDDSQILDSLLEMRWHHQNRAGGASRDQLGCAADQDMFESGSTVGCSYHQIDVLLCDGRIESVKKQVSSNPGSVLDSFEL